MIKDSIKRNTRRAVLVLLALIVCLASVGLPVTAYAQDKPKDYIKSIKYSNIYNSGVRKEVTKALKSSKIPQKDIDCFIWNVRDYNKTVRGKGLIKKGYKTTKKLVPEYDVEFGQGNSRPIIFENGDVLEGYRANPDNE